MLQMVANGFTETRTFNANLQLTDLVSGSNVHLKYNYSATQNNGQITSQQDVISGETITYQYDTLRRLTQASATGDPSGSWSQTFSYDGFANLKQIVGSNAPALSVSVDWATNRLQTGTSYDSNGNMTADSGAAYTYDIENRMAQANPAAGGTVLYGYDSMNHRIYKGAYASGIYSSEEIYFYGTEGHKYGTWRINPSGGVLLQASVTKQWFGGRLVSPQDRLDSRGKYFPYGQERTGVSPANPPNDQEKFASYTRDSATGLDYADQRYYASIYGRSNTPDPSGDSSGLKDPGSWNRYAYVGGDPINRFDPLGLDWWEPDTNTLH
jgi:RHS repeat-associated protein